MNRGKFELRHGHNKAASPKRVFQGITAATTDKLPVLRTIQMIGSPTLPMAEM